LANKQYISIIRLFEHCAVDTTGEELNLPRIKKHLNAEFSHSNTGFIEVGGYSYTRQDVFEELEQTDFPARLGYHKRLWENKNILNFLENNQLNLQEIGTEFNNFYCEKEFDVFFSPYFAAPFNYASRNFLNELQFGNLAKLHLYDDFLQPMDREEAFKATRIFLQENLRTLNNVSEQNYKIIYSKIKLWIHNDWPVFFNRLPDEFYDIKTAIFSILINLTVKLQHSHKGDCKKISHKLVAVTDIPTELEDLALNNHKVYTGAADGQSKSYGWLVWVGIIVIKLIALGGC